MSKCRQLLSIEGLILLDMIKYAVKKHPYLSMCFAWLTAFCTYGIFMLERETQFNYLSPLIFGLIIILVNYKYQQKKNPQKTIEKKAFIKFTVVVIVIVVYMMTAAYFYSITPFSTIIKGRNPIVLFYFGLAALVGICIFLTVRKKWTYEKAVVMMFAFSFLLHFYYFNYIGLKAQFDLGEFMNQREEGHLGYMKWLYDHFLPAQFDPRERWQFYHPPLNHYIAAIFIHIQTFFGVLIFVAVHNIQYLPFLYCMVMLITVYKIGKELGLKKIPLLIYTAIVTFSPAFYIIANYVNNDMLSVTFMMLALYRAIKWYKNRRIGNILLVALFFGLGMFTKLSTWMVAVPIAVLFIAALVQNLKGKDFKGFRKLFGQMAAFMMVAAPLSLYWSLRNLIRFGVPLGYIPTSNAVFEHIYVGKYQRLFDFSLWQLADPDMSAMSQGGDYNEYNPLIALIKTASTNCCSWKQYRNMVIQIDSIELWVSIALAAVSLIGMIYILIKSKNMKPVYKVMFSLFYIVLMTSYYVFCIRYPELCTENIRYASPVIWIGAVFTGYAYKEAENRNSKVSKLIKTGIAALTAVYCVSSYVMFMCDGVMENLKNFNYFG